MEGLPLEVDPLWVAPAILVVTYALLLADRVHRTVVALLGAGVMTASGVITQEQAIAGIDFNTIALLTGMMIIVAITRRSGVFEYVAIWSAKRAGGEPGGVLIMLALVTAVLSAFLDNLTTVLLVVPVAMLIADKLQVSPYPFLVSQILASNVGGAATLIGDPPNILIGSATGFSFTDFLIHMGPVSLMVMAMLVALFYLVWGRSLQAPAPLKERVMRFDERASITDPALLKKSLALLALVIAGFVVGEHYDVRPGTVAMFGAALLLLVTGLHTDRRGRAENTRKALAGVEWSALFFFIGLFVIVHGVESTGLLATLADQLLLLTRDDPMVTALTTLWLAAVVSAAIDNIPFVATMIPLVESMEPALGPEALEPVWWALALGACLGGNGSLIGSAANVLVAGLADRAGTPLRFGQFLLIGLPFMFASITVAHLALYVRHFV
jgi:Na+/H+ antiporter NhaD/arsenite permease-like protein